MKTILLIDDDDGCRAPAAEMLRQAGWQVFEAADGERGIELAVKHRPDVVLCDLLMPRANGYHVCRAVRAHLELRHTKVIVITGRDYDADRKAAEEAGADDYLVKPIVFAEIEAALARVLPARPEEPAREDAEPPWLPERGTRIKFWGVRGSIPSPGPDTVFFGGNTSCVEVRADGQLIVLDAGSGMRALGLALAEEFQQEPIVLTLLITHTHWDHIQGFPFFLPAYEARNRLRILGYEGARASLAATLAGQMESPYFPIALQEMPGNIVIEEQREMEFQIGPIRVQACFSKHPGICVGYRLWTSAGSIVYLPDNESGSLAPEADPPQTVPSHLDSDLLAFIHEADVLICDAQYTAEEYRAHLGWGHGCLDEVVQFALAGGVKRLFLFHHDPAHDDRFLSSMLMRARTLVEEAGGTMRVETAREAAQVVLRTPAGGTRG